MVKRSACKVFKTAYIQYDVGVATVEAAIVFLRPFSYLEFLQKGY